MSSTSKCLPPAVVGLVALRRASETLRYTARHQFPAIAILSEDDEEKIASFLRDLAAELEGQCLEDPERPSSVLQQLTKAATRLLTAQFIPADPTSKVGVAR